MNTTKCNQAQSLSKGNPCTITKHTIIQRLNFSRMKNLKIVLYAFALILVSVQLGTTQCDGDSWNFDEDDFMPGSISQVEAGVASPVTTNPYDLDNDGTNDVQVTYEAIITTPNSNGTCDDGDFTIGAGWGGTGALTTSSDFAGTASDDCPCTNGIIVMTIDFINGWNSDVANFEFEATSQNGSSEGYEYGFGFVTAATDATGASISGLNSAAAASSAIAGYCNAQYAGGMTVSSIALPSTVGVFTNQADDLNATINDCASSGQNGEDTGSGTGPNSSLSTGVSGLNPTDLITQVTYIYGLSNAPGTDCDSDGDTGVGTSPSGSFAGVSGCFAAPCGFPTEPTITLEESCGSFNIVVGEIDESGASGNGADVSYDTSATGTFANAVTGMEGLDADGTDYYIQICDADDATCCDVFGPYSVTGTIPVAPTFVLPCEDIDPTPREGGSKN